MPLSDSFIDSVINPEHKSTDDETKTMISREFYGMEAVAQFDEEDYTSNESEE